MQKNKAAIVAKREIKRGIQPHRQFDLYSVEVSREDERNRERQYYDRKSLRSNEVACQSEKKRDNLRSSCYRASVASEKLARREIDEQPDILPNEEVRVGAVRKVAKKKTRKIYLPELVDHGVGTFDLRHLKRRERKTSTKCIGAVFECTTGSKAKYSITSNQIKSMATSPIAPGSFKTIATEYDQKQGTKDAAVAPHSKANDIEIKNIKSVVVIKSRSYSSSVITEIHDFIDDATKNGKADIKPCLVTPQICDSQDLPDTVAVPRSSSTLKRRFEALKKGFRRKDVAQKLFCGQVESSKRNKDISSVISNSKIISYLKSGIFSGHKQLLSDQKIFYDDSGNKSPQISSTQLQEQVAFENYGYDDINGVKGMFRLWSKRFTFDDNDSIKNPTSSCDMRVHVDEEIPEKQEITIEKKQNRFLLFKRRKSRRKSYKRNKTIITGCCQVNEGVMIKVEPSIPRTKSKKSEKIRKQNSFALSWIQPFQNKAREYGKSVHVRWNNRLYTKSSSVFFELMSDVYSDADKILKSKSEFAARLASYRTRKAAIPRTEYANRNIEAWMVQEAIFDRSMELDMRNKKRYIEKSKAFSQNEVVLQLKNFTKLHTHVDGEKYLEITIPKGFFTESNSDNDAKGNFTSDEHVYNIIDYELHAEEENVQTNTVTDVHRYIGNHNTNAVHANITIKTSSSVTLKRPPTIKTLKLQDSIVYMPKKCDVIGVGILTYRDAEIVSRPIEPFPHDTSHDESQASLIRAQNKCEFAQRYLQEYYKHYMPLEKCSFFPWSFSDTHLQSYSTHQIYADYDTSVRSCPNLYDDCRDLSGDQLRKSIFDVCSWGEIYQKCSAENENNYSHNTLRNFVARSKGLSKRVNHSRHIFQHCVVMHSGSTNASDRRAVDNKNIKNIVGNETSYCRLYAISHNDCVLMHSGATNTSDHHIPCAVPVLALTNDTFVGSPTETNEHQTLKVSMSQCVVMRSGSTNTPSNNNAFIPFEPQRRTTQRSIASGDNTRSESQYNASYQSLSGNRYKRTSVPCKISKCNKKCVNQLSNEQMCSFPWPLKSTFSNQDCCQEIPAQYSYEFSPPHSPPKCKIERIVNNNETGQIEVPPIDRLRRKSICPSPRCEHHNVLIGVTESELGQNRSDEKIKTKELSPVCVHLGHCSCDVNTEDCTNKGADIKPSNNQNEANMSSPNKPNKCMGTTCREVTQGLKLHKPPSRPMSRIDKKSSESFTCRNDNSNDVHNYKVIPINSTEGVTVRLKKDTPSTAEIRVENNLEKNCSNSCCINDVNIMQNNLEKNCSKIENAQIKPDKSESVGNIVEINLKLKVRKGDKTTVVNFGHDDDKPVIKQKRNIAQAPQEVFILNNNSEHPGGKKLSKNDLNINIIIQNCRNNEEEYKYINGEHEQKYDLNFNNFSSNISQKFCTVSTGYSDQLQSKQEALNQTVENFLDLTTFSVHRTTVDLTSSIEKSKEHCKMSSDESSVPTRTSISSKTSRNVLSPDSITEVSATDFTLSKHEEEKYDTAKNLKASTVSVNQKSEDLDQAYATKQSSVNGDQNLTASSINMTEEELRKFSETNRKLTKREKKEALKELFEKAGKEEHNKKNVKGFRNILQSILTSSSSNVATIAVVSNDILKEVNCSSVVPGYYEEDEHVDGTDSYYSIADDYQKPKGCMCSTLAARLNAKKKYFDDSQQACCCKKQKYIKHEETNCDLRPELDYSLFNIKTTFKEVQTQNSIQAYLDGVHPSNDLNKQEIIKSEDNIFDSTKEMDEYERLLNIKKSDNKIRQGQEMKLNRHTLLGLTSDNKVIFLNNDPKDTSMEAQLFEELLNSNNLARDVDRNILDGSVQKSAELLQSYESKKAVLQIYAEKNVSGEHFIAKLPKFLSIDGNELNKQIVIDHSSSSQKS